MRSRPARQVFSENSGRPSSFLLSPSIPQRIRVSLTQRWISSKSASARPNLLWTRRRFQNGQDLGNPHAAALEIQKRKEGIDQLALLPDPLVGDAERNPPGISRREGEDRLNIRGIGLDIRRHDQDVLGEESRIRFKKSQQAILEHLDFSHRAVAGVDLNGSILLADLLLFIRAAPPVDEIQNIGLNALEEAVISRSFKGFMFLTAEGW